MTSVPVLAPSSPKVWSIPPGEDFLGELAATLAEETSLSEHPDALADALIYVPNRRSARVLALKLFEAAGGKPILPPDIRALGDLEADEPPTGTEEAIAGLGPPLSPGRRLGALASMVLQFYAARDLPLPPRSAVAAAQELSRLLDQAALSGEVDWSRLPDLVENTDLAHHWAQSAEFLKIVTDYWPDWLAAHGASDPFERRLAVANAIASHWMDSPPGGLVVVAGSTGATPASRALMQAARRIEQGRVVLPGLDQDMPGENWRSLVDVPDHPQHALANTLVELGLDPAEIAHWPIANRRSAADARAKLVHESLAPASATANWLERLDDLSGDETPSDFASAALEGLSIQTARTEDEEALFAALLLRQSLETTGQTAALVTPDAGLARRVSNELTRWGVSVSPSAGEPLLRTQAGRFIGLIADWMLDPAAPIALVSLLKHPFVFADPEAVRHLEMDCLRGPRVWKDLLDLKERSAGVDDVQGLMEHLVTLWETFGVDPDAPYSGQSIAERIASLAQGLCETPDQPWRGSDGAAAARLLESFTEVTGPLPVLDVDDAIDMLMSLADQVNTPQPATHARLSIWGPLEARLQRADHLILAGLNEGVWPAQPAPDAFLPRKFRMELGLATPESRLGLAAHDFAQLACAPKVTLLLSDRREDAPAVASRWVWRLRTLAEGALGREGADNSLGAEAETVLRSWADHLTNVPLMPPDPKLVPSPRPPVSSRPTKLSVTRINTLQRDPYSIYCEQILKLKPLRLLDEAPDARIRGTAIHAALEWLDEAAPVDQTADKLSDRIGHELAAAGEPEEALISDRAIRHRTAEWVMEWYQGRQANIDGPVALECRGALELEIGDTRFRLSAVADRIEPLANGTLSIIDYKTGDPPTNKEIYADLEQQMPLQALIAEAGGFEGVAARQVSELLYVSVKSKSHEQLVKPPPKVTEPATPSELAVSAREGLISLLTEYQNPATPYLSAPRPKFRSKYAGDYERLARRAEWGGDLTDD